MLHLLIYDHYIFHILYLIDIEIFLLFSNHYLFLNIFFLNYLQHLQKFFLSNIFHIHHRMKTLFHLHLIQIIIRMPRGRQLINWSQISIRFWRKSVTQILVWRLDTEIWNWICSTNEKAASVWRIRLGCLPGWSWYRCTVYKLPEEDNNASIRYSKNA